MKRTHLALATCSAALLLAACGGPETAEQTPEADDPIESEGTLTEDPAVGLDEEPGGNMDASDMSGMSDGPGKGMDMPSEGPDGRPSGQLDFKRDEQSEISIIDGTATMMYEDEVLSTEVVELVETCEDAPGETADMQLLTMTSTDTDETLCYGILTLNDETMELTSYPRGNTLNYTRMPVGRAATGDTNRRHFRRHREKAGERSLSAFLSHSRTR